MAQQPRHAAAIERLGECAEELIHRGERAWGDRVARSCAIAAFAFFWLAAALVEPGFLFLLVAAVAVLRFRLRHLPEEPVDDLF
jgi:hypothetical protein